MAVTPEVQTGTPTSAQPGPEPMMSGKQSLGLTIAVYLFAFVPFAVLAGWIIWGWNRDGIWGLNWVTAIVAVVFYYTSGLGVTVGYHRSFTHGSFIPNRPLKIALAIAGQFSVQGAILQWVTDHGRHHDFSDEEGDPHSPTHGYTGVDQKKAGRHGWGAEIAGFFKRDVNDSGDIDSPYRYGVGFLALLKGFWHGHMGWLFHRDMTNINRYAPKRIREDKDLQRIDDLFWLMTLASLFLPAVICGLLLGSWVGFLQGFVLAGVLRIFFLHHVTWSINSICHLIGARPYATKGGDRSANFWPLALFSFGECWHNTHHADPTCAVHGVDRGQIDMSARTIWIFNKLGWVSKVNWPGRGRYAPKVKADGTGSGKKRRDILQPRDKPVAA